MWGKRGVLPTIPSGRGLTSGCNHVPPFVPAPLVSHRPISLALSPPPFTKRAAFCFLRSRNSRILGRKNPRPPASSGVSLDVFLCRPHCFFRDPLLLLLCHISLIRQHGQHRVGAAQRAAVVLPRGARRAGRRRGAVVGDDGHDDDIVAQGARQGRGACACEEGGGREAANYERSRRRGFKRCLVNDLQDAASASG